jgi:integrase
MLRDTVYADGIPCIGVRDVMSLRPLDWEDYRRYLAAQEFAVGRKRSAWTVALHLISLKTMINWAVESGRLPYNPLDRAKANAKSKREIAPTEAQISLLLSQADLRMRYVILAACDAGMRRDELRLCERAWVDRKAKQIKLDAKVCKLRKGRVVPATTRLLDAIAAIPEHVRLPWILTNPVTEAAYSDSLLDRNFRDLADSVGLIGVRIHDLRHACATHMVARGIRLTRVQKILGHERLETTFRYVNDQAEDLSEVIAVFEAGIEKDKRR